MKKNLVIVEYKDEVDYLSRYRQDLLTGDTLILSLLPQASVALADLGVSYFDSLQFFTKTSHEETLLAVDQIMKKIDSWLVMKDGHGIKLAYNNAFCFYSRPFLGNIVFNIEVILNFLADYDIERIFSFSYRNNDYVTTNLGPHERILGNVLKCFQNHHQVTVFERNIGRKFRQKGFRRMLKSWAGLILSGVEKFKFRKPARPSVLLYSLKYNFDQLVRGLDGYSFFNLTPNKEFLKTSTNTGGVRVAHLYLNDVFCWNPKIFQSTFVQSSSQIKEMHKQEKIFVFKGIDFSPVMFQKMDKGYARVFCIMHRKIASLFKILKRLQPSVVVSSESRGLSFALGEMCRRLNIPAALLSHGSHVTPKNEYDRLEWLDHGKGLIDTAYQYHMLQSPWAREYADNMTGKNNYIDVTPFIFAKVDRSQKEKKQDTLYPQAQGKKVIVHASTPKSRIATRLYIYETMDEYIQNIRDLIEATKDNPDVFLIIRFRPSCDLAESDLRKLLPDYAHYTIATKGSFVDYLEIADLLVSFSSTTIEEALLSHIPVLQYDRTGRYEHIPSEKWRQKGFLAKNSVYWIGSQSQLKLGLEWILNNHLKGANDDQMYDRHVFDANRVPSVAQAVVEILEQKSPQKETAYA